MFAIFLDFPFKLSSCSPIKKMSVLYTQACSFHSGVLQDLNVKVYSLATLIILL